MTSHVRRRNLRNITLRITKLPNFWHHMWFQLGTGGGPREQAGSHVFRETIFYVKSKQIKSETMFTISAPE